jgi:25S rRNA (uracil2634-N3)-methyltransferase
MISASNSFSHYPCRYDIDFALYRRTDACEGPLFTCRRSLTPALAQAQNYSNRSPQTSEPHRMQLLPQSHKPNLKTQRNMSKTKTKRARRELKREGDRKIAAHHKRTLKAAETNKASPTQPSKKKQKMNTPTTKDASATTPAPVQAAQKPRIPFSAYDHILLVGEGDFSFTRSLAIEHGCANVVGTSYDTLEEVREKYPTFADIETELGELVPPVPVHHGIDATKLSSYKHLRCRRSGDDEVEETGEEEGENVPKGEGWDTIAFMFPHTGGLSTDVNRQVRVNQALLVAFFNSCLDTPSPKRRLALLEAQKNKVCSLPTPKAQHN